MRTLLVVAVSCIALAHPNTATAHPGSGIAVDGEGRVFFTDTGKGVWRREWDGQLTLISETAMHWMAYDNEGRFSQAPDQFGEWFERLTPRGERPTLISCSDFPCAIGRDGNLYFAKMHGLTIVRRTPTGIETVLVTAKDFGIAMDRPVGVNGIACGDDGKVYLVALESKNRNEGSGDHALYSVAKDRSIKTIAKNFVRRDLPASQQHPEVRPQYSRGMAVDPRGNVFVAVTGSRCIMRVTPEGFATVILECSKPWSPTGVDVKAGDLYVLEYDDETPTEGRNWPPRVRRLDKDGRVAILADFSVDRNTSANARSGRP